MSSCACLNAAEVAELLRLDLAAFWSKRPYLARRHGFPRPVPGLGMVWSRAQVEGWLAEIAGDAVAAAPCESGPPAKPVPNISPVARAQARLEAAYAGRRA